MKPVRELHQSEIHAFLRCGKLWEFRYVQGLKIPPRAYHTVGRAVDRAITLNLTQKIQSGADLKESEVLDLCSTDFDKESVETEWMDDKPGEQKDLAVACVRAHHREIAPKIHPATVQEKFVLETDAGYNLGGTIDIVEVDDTVRDSKTSKSKYSDDAVYRALQPALYDFAFEALRGRPAKAFAYDVMIKPTKTLDARTQIVAAKVTPEDREWLFDTIHNVDRAMRAGVALPAPEGSWQCSPKWCGFWSKCKGKKS